MLIGVGIRIGLYWHLQSNNDHYIESVDIFLLQSMQGLLRIFEYFLYNVIKFVLLSVKLSICSGELFSLILLWGQLFLVSLYR
jgi:hypothetical protein